MFDAALEVLLFLRSVFAAGTPDEDLLEQTHDYQLRLIRVAKKLSKSVLEFAIHLSGLYFQADSLSAAPLTLRTSTSATATVSGS